MRFFTTFLTAVLVVGFAANTRAAKGKPNIILAMTDDQGWGDTGYNGHPALKTPVLDEMAAVGLRFDRFYAAAPVCSPTRGSVLTGRHPNRFGCFSWGHTLRPQEITIAEALKTAGYATGHFGKWHLGSVRANSPVCPGNSGFDEWASSPNFYENNPLLSHNGRVIETRGESSHVTMNLALDWIRHVNAMGVPFLAVIWFGNPHGPHVAVEKYKAMYPDQPEAQQHFLGEITAMDHSMGVMRAELRKLDIADNTLLWFCSDNGAIPKGSTGGLSGRKGSLYEGGIRVPAIIEWPAKIRKPSRVNLSCNTTDIYPTLLELAGIKPPINQAVLDGVSLAPLLNGHMKARGNPMGFWVYPERGRGRKSRQLLELLREEQTTGKESLVPDEGRIEKKYPAKAFPGPAAWIEGNFKLHRLPRKKSAEFDYKLFNLKTDVGEKHNLSQTQSKRLEEMKAALARWQSSVIRSLNGGDYQ